MSTRDIKMYIGTQFPQIEIIWINDSSCTVTFPDEEQTEQAYMQFSVGRASLKVTNLERQGSVVTNPEPETAEQPEAKVELDEAAEVNVVAEVN